MGERVGGRTPLSTNSTSGTATEDRRERKPCYLISDLSFESRNLLLVTQCIYSIYAIRKTGYEHGLRAKEWKKLTSRFIDSKCEVNKGAGGKEGLQYGIVQVGVHANVTAERWMERREN